MLDEVLDLFAAGLSKGLCAAEVDGVGLYEFGIELVLADELAETVADLGASAIPVPIRLLGRKLLKGRDGPDFLDRADADAIGLAQGTIDGSGFRDPHLGAANEQRNVGRIGIGVADETRRIFGRINRRFEDETFGRGVTQRIDGLDVDSPASLASRQAKETCVRYVPASFERD